MARKKNQIEQDQTDKDFEDDEPESDDSVEPEQDESNSVVYGDDTYTYVGAGADSPRVINFMGRVKFVRGQPTEVTDPIVLAKIENNQCFVKGTVSDEELYEMDKAGKEHADNILKRDRQMDNVYRKKHLV